MSARSEILATLRRRLNRRKPLDESLRKPLEAGLADPLPGPQPGWDEDPVERFVRKSKTVHCTVAFVETAASIPAAVERYLGEQGLPPAIAAAPHPLIAGLAWPPGVELAWRRAEGEDATGLSVAWAAIAETGTLAMLSSAESLASINFLPAVHIVVLPRKRILRQQEDLWALLRKEGVPMPRALNLITGPSKTGDVEQTIVYGAHGPGRVHLLIVG